MKTIHKWRIIFISLIVALICCSFSLKERQEDKIEESELMINVNRYYYDQLTYIEKEIYNKLVDNEENFINNQDIYCISYKISTEEKEKQAKEYENYVKRAVKAYKRDNPNATIFFNMGLMCKKTKNDTIEIYIIPEQKEKRYNQFNSKEVQEALEEIELEAKSFVETLKGDEYSKLLQIHNWIIDIADYDESLSLENNNNVYGAIIQNECVCSGYAYAFKYVSDLAGLNVLYVQGKVLQGEDLVYHAWNMAYVDGSWKIIDVTFDEFYRSKKSLYGNIDDVTYYPDEKFYYPNVDDSN